MSTSKKHHYVPQMYLRNFADGAQRVQTLRLASGHSYAARTDTIAFENHFHRITIDGIPNLDLENAATSVEGHAAQPILRLTDPCRRVWPIPDQDRAALALFIAFQYLRVPAARDMLLSLADQLPDMFDGQVPEELALDRADIPRLHGATMTGEALLRAAKEVSRRSWTVIDFERKSLITSDVPVALVRRDGATDRSAAGLTTHSAYIPLARRTALSSIHLTRPSGRISFTVERLDGRKASRS
ncbi:DUF4238 domain-containing protein [Streptomyces sp. NPDC102364]|uniref:DUF4238 domain-containing protein n=1 Tax=Streptomyces sp. NPDC102364 TaxID=3366161 RepID=UPI0038138EED